MYDFLILMHKFLHVCCSHTVTSQRKKIKQPLLSQYIMLELYQEHFAYQHQVRYLASFLSFSIRKKTNISDHDNVTYKHIQKAREFKVTQA